MGLKSRVLIGQNLRYYLIALAPITSIFFLIPFELYYTAREYWNWHYTLPISFAAAGAILYLLTAIIIWISIKINCKLAAYTSLFLFFLGIFILLADVFSPLQTTLLDGSEIVSAEPLKHSLIEAVIFITILIISVKTGRSAFAVATPVSIILILISVGYCGLILTSSKPIMAISGNPNFDPTIKGNVYHIVLDEMQTDIAELFLEETNGYEPFEGFTFFPNNISNYLFTSASLPSYMTGSLYKFGTFSNWQTRYKKKGLLRKLYDNGYNISFYSARKNHCTKDVSKCVSLDDIFEEVTVTKNAVYKDFIQIWFSRLIPNFFTNQALEMGMDLSEWLLRLTGLERKDIPFSNSEGKEPFASVHMLSKLLKDERVRPADGQYIYAHSILPHGPYVMNARGKYEPSLQHKKTIGYYEQVKCAFNKVTSFLEELKRLNRYDKATIILHGDTGHGHRGFIKKLDSKLTGSFDNINLKVTAQRNC